MSDSDGGAAAHLRRRSVDVGGLALALGNSGLGHGWGGWEEQEMGEIRYAELLGEMYTQTQETVNHHQSSLEYASPPIEIPASSRQRLIESLDSWNFEPHKLPEEEVLCCTQILFETLFRVEGMQEAIGLPLSQISQFIRHLRTIYRVQNSYHNFQHALDVLQATQTFLCAAGKVPPVAILAGDDDDGRMFIPEKGRDDELISSLDNQDLFILYIAAIGHDVGHPGFTNAFMKNAKTPLSLVYNDTSALEQMHYTLLLQIMHHNGLGDLIDRHDDSGVRFRKLMSDVVLATDMSVHGEFMRRFGELVEGKEEPGKEVACRVTLMCQALIKCADISNPSRPHGVSQHWASALSAEWTSQVQLEEHFHLPSTLKPSTNPLAQANSQIFFITNFAKPLLDLTAKAIPQMTKFAEQCTQNLKTWDTRSKELRATTSGTMVPPEPRQSEVPFPSSQSIPEVFLNAFPLTLPVHWVGPPAEDTMSTLPDSESLNPLPTHAPTPTPPYTHLPSISTLFSLSSPLISPAESVGSCLLSPRLDTPSTLHSHPSHPYRPSSAGSTNSSSDATNAMRAAYHASVRKKRSIQNRNSWNASPIGSGSFYSPPPPLPTTPAQGLSPTATLDDLLVKDSKASSALPDSSSKANNGTPPSNLFVKTDTTVPLPPAKSSLALKTPPTRTASDS